MYVCVCVHVWGGEGERGEEIDQAHNYFCFLLFFWCCFCFQVVPGETALAFYTAHNPTDRAVTGIATYNVIPFEAGQYFNKIQCFCFEEQRLNPHEEVQCYTCMHACTLMLFRE